jgi:hypothetical protein
MAYDSDYQGGIPSQKIVGRGFDWGKIQMVGICCPLTNTEEPVKIVPSDPL